jgi:hypothetical protein
MLYAEEERWPDIARGYILYREPDGSGPRFVQHMCCNEGKKRINLQKEDFVHVTDISENFTKYGVSCTKHVSSYNHIKISLFWPHI